jgi:hypothetical protein
MAVAAQAQTDRPVRSPLLQDKTLDGGYLKIQKTTWSTYGIDVGAGLLAPVPVTPLIAIVDAAIIMSVNGDKTPVMKGLANGYRKLFFTPHLFFTDPFWMKMTVLCWMVYGGTYAAANAATSFNEAHNVSAEDGKWLKLCTSSSANIGLTVVKDVLMVGIIAQYAVPSDPKEAEAFLKARAEAKAAGIKPPKTKVPMLSRASFLCRDALTMGAAFYFADKLAGWFYRSYGEQTLGWSARTSRQFTNLLLPVSIQPVSTVFHLFGLNNAKKPGMPVSEMKTAIGSNYPIATFARMCRILPAVGMGNNFNNELRDYSFRRAERERWI